MKCRKKSHICLCFFFTSFTPHNRVRKRKKSKYILRRQNKTFSVYREVYWYVWATAKRTICPHRWFLLCTLVAILVFLSDGRVNRWDFSAANMQTLKLVCAASASPHFPVRNKINPIILVSGPPTTWCETLPSIKCPQAEVCSSRWKTHYPLTVIPSIRICFSSPPDALITDLNTFIRNIFFHPKNWENSKLNQSNYGIKTALPKPRESEWSRETCRAQAVGIRTLLKWEGGAKEMWLEYFRKVGFHALKE